MRVEPYYDLQDADPYGTESQVSTVIQRPNLIRRRVVILTLSNGARCVDSGGTLTAARTHRAPKTGDSRRISAESLRKRSNMRPPAPKSTPNSPSPTAEEFTTSRWVRSRSTAQRAAEAKAAIHIKSKGINHLESLCDQSTWHWVCYHNRRNVSVGKCSPTPPERRHAT